MYIRMTDLTMSVKLWQSESEDYMYVGTYDNPISGKYMKRDRTLAEAREYVDNMILFPVPSTEETIARGEGFEDCSEDAKDIFTDQLSFTV